MVDLEKKKWNTNYNIKTAKKDLSLQIHQTSKRWVTYDQIFTNKVNNLDEMNKFLGIQTQPKYP